MTIVTIPEPTLHLVCGKIAAGKSTLCNRLADAPATLLIGEDKWMKRLFGPEMHTIEDYVRYSARLREAMGPHIEDVLRAGLSVVLDFPANTVANRQWMRDIFENAGVAHQLHYLEASDASCRARMHARYARGEHDFFVTDEQFDLITSCFKPPTPAEGLHVITYREAR
jgi:predicted kinase